MGINEKARGTRSLARANIADLRHIGAGDTIIQTLPVLAVAGAPTSGTSGTYAANAPAGSKLINTENGVEYVNEGSLASPYWTPTSFRQQGLRAVETDFHEIGDIVAIATANAEDYLNSGVRLFGTGWETNDDSGLLVAAEALKGNLASLTTTNEADHLAAVSMGDSTPQLKPSVHETLVIDIEFTNKTAITLRGLFCGFLGTAADALVPAFTCATTVITLVQDDGAGMLMHADLTDGDGIFLPHNKANAAASIATTATGVDLSETMPAAATFTRWRIEVDTLGNMTAFIDKEQVGSIALALTAATALAPVFYLEATEAVIKQVDIRKVAMWANRA